MLSFLDQPPSAPPGPPIQVRPPPPMIVPQSQTDVPKWPCPRCTYENHGLVATCEMCDAARPQRGTAINATSQPTGLVKTSTCTHQTGCFCHAHLS